MHKCWLILLLLAGSSAHAASFACSSAKTQQEKAICASPQLSAADDELAAAYKAVLVAVPPEFAAETRDDEREWLHWLGAKCRNAERESTRALADCMLDYYPSRTKELRGRILTVGGVTFFSRTVTAKAADDPGMGPANQPEEVNPGFGTLNASWPQANASTPEWKAWNQAIEANTRAMTDAGVSDPPFKLTSKWAAAGGIDAQVTTSLGIVTPELVTATIENVWDGHGAHPNINSIQFNWLLKQGRELRAGDVFRTGSGWDGFLQKRCDKYLHEQLDGNGNSYESFEQPGEMAKTLRGIVMEPKNWKLDGNGLTIVFQVYAVACHACTPPPVTIPWRELQPFLQAGFVPPQ